MDKIRKIRRMGCPKLMDLYPETKGVHLHATLIHTSAITGRIEKELNCDILPTHSSFIDIDCINNECTEGYFDLSSQVVDAIKNNKEIKNRLKCKGKETSRYLKNRTGFSCDTTLDFVITPL